jgi:predicted AlkP superfamily pyrophosphatase or phosphodiesterase
MKKMFLLLSLLLIQIFTLNSLAQKSSEPKLVVGIVVDQMRYDYLYRFGKYFRKDGFNRLINNGSNFTFAHYNYLPTSTSLGHATLYTGTSPFAHGIISNDWYDKKSKKMVYCVSDTSMKSVGSDDNAGQMSPNRILTTTITDQLKLATNKQAKVISISLKDKAAVIPGGHMADAAFWYNGRTGNFITSSYYMKELPKWVNDFNNNKFVEKYLNAGWKLSPKLSGIVLDTDSDESKYEKDLFKENKVSFPHLFDKLNEKEKYSALIYTPYANRMVADLSKAAVINEKLGSDEVTDFLAISFSSTDYVGHEYGNYSYELADTYIKLDEVIAELISFLDKQVGKGKYLLYLTADHAAMDSPGYSKDNRIPGGFLSAKAVADSIKAFAKREYNDERIVENFSKQIYFDREVLKQKNISIHEVERKFKDYLRDTFSEIASIFTRDELESLSPSRQSNNFLLNCFNFYRSGDVVLSLQSNYLPGKMEKGTTHGSEYSYDTHVPLIFYGWRIPKQTINTPVFSVDVAPTISDLLGITEPSGCIGIPLLNP